MTLLIYVFFTISSDKQADVEIKHWLIENHLQFEEDYPTWIENYPEFMKSILQKLSGVRIIRLVTDLQNDEDLKRLEGLSHLEMLTVGEIKNLDLISKFRKLTHLDIALAESGTIDKLSNLTQLYDFRCIGDLRDVSEISKLKNIRYLHLKRTKVENISAFKALTKLIEIHLDESNIEDLNGLEGCINLEYISLRQTNVSDLNSLKNCKKLITLDLSNTEVKELNSLKNSSKLKQLLLVGTKVKDLEPLSALKNLNSLDISYTKVTNITPLFSLKNLRTLYAYDLEIPEQQLNELKILFPNCEIIL